MVLGLHAGHDHGEEAVDAVLHLGVHPAAAKDRREAVDEAHSELANVRGHDEARVARAVLDAELVLQEHAVCRDGKRGAAEHLAAKTHPGARIRALGHVARQLA